ncbi:hypothetical protein GCM10009837_44780 [Streptomyces durmitorensis]|uniref:RlpA-like protein double-psi beta-barrel domain-containing protein n=1 Tax=Streptomyces durmitorensis TaxID=319947 RepID=A0ABY4Q5M9_9ACTN|nr:hypothetical protein [Streptomyces durmitorensis]UQT60528.1 hypothetical protein M4V62_38695 [Streptomyces durmitorensis]
MNRWKLTYVSVAGIAAVAVLTGPTATGAAAVSPHAPHAPGAAATAAPRPTLTAKATVSSVRAWQQFRMYGVSHHMRTGTRVTLQQKQGKRWVSLPASVNTTRSATYNMRVKLGLKGRNALRIVGGGAISPVVNVTVR